jgi:hypothetical protein
VPDLEHGTSLVESGLADGSGLHSLIGVSLYRSWSLQLGALSHAL